MINVCTKPDHSRSSLVDVNCQITDMNSSVTASFNSRPLVSAVIYLVKINLCRRLVVNRPEFSSLNNKRRTVVYVVYLMT